MMQFKKSLRFLSLTFTIVILCSACGGSDGSSPERTGDTSTETITPVEPIAVKNSNVEIEKPVDSKSEEKVKEELKKMAEGSPKTEKEKKKEVKKAPKKRAKIHFTEEVFDYGFIMQGDTVQHDFYFKNVGNDDLVIKRVEPSCGCTVPIYPKEPIAPGEDGKIAVTFKSAGKLGRQVPSIKVFTNDNRRIKLELKGYVDAEREKPRQIVKEKQDTTQQ